MDEEYLICKSERYKNFTKNRYYKIEKKLPDDLYIVEDDNYNYQKLIYLQPNHPMSHKNDFHYEEVRYRGVNGG